MICCLECGTPIVLRPGAMPKDCKVTSCQLSNVQCTACGSIYEMTINMTQGSELPAHELEARRNVNR